MNPFPVSIIITMRNSATTILHTLDSVISQKYPVKEIIVIDNVSSDNSIDFIKKYKKRIKIPLELIRRKENQGVAASYNLGIKRARFAHVILMHSDSSLPTRLEIYKLTQPFRNDVDVVGTYPKVLLPEKVWDKYNFWQKCLFVRSVGREIPGFNGKFDCLERKIFLKVGGFNEDTFGKDEAVGGEDADLYLRLEKEGKIVLSKARVIHLHYLGTAYRLFDWIRKRKLLARTYGRLMRFQGRSLPLQTYGRGLSIKLGMMVFLIKPILAILPFIPKLQLFGITLLFLYAFLNSRKMYTTNKTLMDHRIVLLPFIDVFLVYYETFWMLEAFFFSRKRV